ncbi:MAG: hypothetical protein ACOYJK_09275 [Prevotella sp.]|jgi:hypothetical protein
MRKTFTRYVLLLAVLLLCSVAKAQNDDYGWKLSSDGTEWLYTYTTQPRNGYVNGYYYTNIIGTITFSFRNETTKDRIANDRWADFKMRIGNIEGFNSSGNIKFYGYYGETRYNLTSSYSRYKGNDGKIYEKDFPFYFTYYKSENVNRSDYNWIFPNDHVFNDGYWWDMDVQSSIKIFLVAKNGDYLETISIPRPRDPETMNLCYSTTEGTIRHYRTNMYNRYDKKWESLNKSVRFAKKSGDGTYLFNPVWTQFTTGEYVDENDPVNPGIGRLKAENKYVTALDWTGEINDNSVVAAQYNKDNNKYELSLNAVLPMTTKENAKDLSSHFMMQAIVRAPKDGVIQMGLQYADPVTKQYKYIYPDNAKVKGVGMSDDPNNQIYGTIYPTGRVDYLKRIANGGWVKLEGAMRIVNPNSTVDADLWTMECWGRMLLSSDQPFQVSDVFLLWRPNQDTYYQTSANGADNDVNDKNINTSWVDLSNQRKFSLFDRGDNLNRVVKVGANSIFSLEGHEHPCNVVVEGKDGAIGHTPLLYLTDRGVLTTDADGFKVNTGVWANQDNTQYKRSGYTFGVNEGFTADKVWFDRNFARKQYGDKYYSMSTICLPFAMDANDLQKFNVTNAYEFSTANGNTATFKEVTATEADKPYLIEPSEAIETANDTPLEFANKEIPASNIAAGDFIGTYKFDRLPATDGGYTNYIFGFNTQKFNYVKSTGANFKPFRAYLRSATANGAKSIVLSFDGTANGIDQTLAPQERSNAPIYSIDGKMVSPMGSFDGLQKGVYIQNGKKIIIK